MPRVSDIVVIYRNEQPSLVIDAVTKVDAVPDLVKENFAKIERYLEKAGECATEVPFVVYHNDNMEKLEVEVGVSTKSALIGSGEIRFEAIPSGKVVMCMHIGPRSTIRPVYDEITAWIKKHKLKAVGYIVEYYYASSEMKDEENLVTKVVVPLK